MTGRGKRRPDITPDARANAVRRVVAGEATRTAIASELGVSQSTVSGWVDRLAPDHAARRRSQGWVAGRRPGDRRLAFRAWAEANRDVALTAPIDVCVRESGGDLLYETARLVLREIGRPKAPPVDWSGVDWSQQDAEIARQLGVSDVAVSVRRRKAGEPRSPRHGRKPKGFAASAADKAEAVRRIEAAAAEIGYSVLTLFRWREQLRREREARAAASRRRWAAWPARA